MKYLVYLGKPNVTLKEIEAVQMQLRESKGFTILADDETCTYKLGSKNPKPISWSDFGQIKAYQVQAQFEPVFPSIERLVRVVCQDLPSIRHIMQTSIVFNERGAQKKEDQSTCLSIKTSVKRENDPNKELYLKLPVPFPENSPERTEYLEFLKKLFPNIQMENSHTSSMGLYIQRKDCQVETIYKIVSYLTDKIDEIKWSIAERHSPNMGAEFNQFLANPVDHDTIEYFLSAKTKSIGSLEQLMPMIDDGNKFLYNFGYWSLKGVGQNKKGLLVPGVVLTHKGFQFMAAGTNPVHKGADLSDEMRDHLFHMEVNLLQPAPRNFIKDDDDLWFARLYAGKN